MCNIGNGDFGSLKNLKNACVLVSWVGSDPDERYDIISVNDVVFDNKFTLTSLKVSESVMVKCGKAKSLATVKMISENTDLLHKELNKLQSQNEKENVDPNPSKPKRLRYDDTIGNNKANDYIQVDLKDSEKDKIILSLSQENQKLKTELSEAQKIINAFCKDLKQLVNGVQKKIHEKENDNGREYLKESSISCPVVELCDKVLIGTGRTEIPRQVFAQINWLSYPAATRKLLMAVFSREVLATHTLTGKPSPAFLSSDLPSKNRLDPKKVADIIEIVTSKCGVPDSLVRNAITTKCADENKMFKKRLEKLKHE